MLAEIEEMNSNEPLRYEHYKENETIDDIDCLIEKRMRDQGKENLSD